MHQIRAASNASNDQIRSPAIHCQHIWPFRYTCTWDWAADDPELRTNHDIDNIPLHLYLKRFLLQVHCQRLELGLIWAQHYKGEHSSIGTILDSYSSSEAHWRQCERSQEEGGWRVQGWVGLKYKMSEYHWVLGELAYFCRHQLGLWVSMSQQLILWSSTPRPQQPGSSVRRLDYASS